MTEIVRTRNVRLVEKILRSDPKLWDAAGGNELEGPPELPDHEDAYYLLCRHVEHGLLGLCIFIRVDGEIYTAHANFLSEHWGSHRDETAQAARDCMSWMFSNTNAKRLTAHIPERYLPVQLFAERIGMTCTALTDDGKQYQLDKEDFA